MHVWETLQSLETTALKVKIDLFQLIVLSEHLLLSAKPLISLQN